MKTVARTFVEVDGKQVPTKLYRENRNGARASIGKNNLILRMPNHIDDEEEQKIFNWFIDWVRKNFEKNDALRLRYFGKGYKNGDILKVGTREYSLQIDLIDKKSHNAKLNNRHIHLMLSKNDNEVHRQTAIKHLLSRLIAQDFRPHITRRVNELNNMYFRMNVKSVNFKYNHSNWGSCSSKSNLNFSTRLFFAPDDVIDYVIIHELAHLIEMNHGPNFWKLVRDAMPNYKEKEQWLDDNGEMCHF